MSSYKPTKRRHRYIRKINIVRARATQTRTVIILIIVRHIVFARFLFSVFFFPLLCVPLFVGRLSEAALVSAAYGGGLTPRQKRVILFGRPVPPAHATFRRPGRRPPIESISKYSIRISRVGPATELRVICRTGRAAAALSVCLLSMRSRSERVIIILSRDRQCDGNTTYSAQQQYKRRKTK